MTKELEEKYAKLWLETNGWNIPKGLEPFERIAPKDNYSRNLYISGMWRVLHMMAQDGLITQQKLRELHDKEPGMKRGQSRITI